MANVSPILRHQRVSYNARPDIGVPELALGKPKLHQFGLAASNVEAIELDLETMFEGLDPPSPRKKAVFDHKAVVGPDNPGRRFFFELPAKASAEVVAQLIFAADEGEVAVGIIARPLHQKAALASDDGSDGGSHKLAPGYGFEEPLLTVHARTFAHISPIARMLLRPLAPTIT